VSGTVSGLSLSLNSVTILEFLSELFPRIFRAGVEPSALVGGKLEGKYGVLPGFFELGNEFADFDFGCDESLNFFDTLDHIDLIENLLGKMWETEKKKLGGRKKMFPGVGKKLM
jgi:hypothetical protein